ncbi:MAG: polynucleotide adenylyltransferase PcnB [Gammaproteobacteria bacterium]|nr:polynucleotide adenylyltransferase PcnB [Gammaproteobacteria bacterium]
MKPIRQTIHFDKKLIDKDAQKVVKTLNKAGHEAYLVGGCIRDLLLGHKPKDFDIATSATPEQVHKTFKRSRLIGRRFRLVHIMFSSRKYIEVATFRSGKVKTTSNGVIVRDNLYGTLKEDAFRRDFSVNGLYYDIQKSQVIDYVDGLEALNNSEIKMIGKPVERFKEDPVRMIRAIRFKVKLGATIDPKISKSISNLAYLIANIPAARLYDECIKLFHNENAYEVFEQLIKYGLLNYLFPQTEETSFINKTLLNTSKRIKNGKPVTPAFLFAVFLWGAQNKRFNELNKKKKSRILTMTQASEDVINEQTKKVLMPRWLSARVKDIWLLQYQLENCGLKKAKELIAHPRFRMAYDFLVLRSESINPELSKRAKYWTQLQQ